MNNQYYAWCQKRFLRSTSGHLLSGMASDASPGDGRSDRSGDVLGFVRPPTALSLDGQECRATEWRSWNRQWDAFAELTDLEKSQPASNTTH